MLEAMLSLRHPGMRFEVINAAMTGINSHTILPIARDCAKAHGDIWVIYMGNNEVVGPFGAGTVFGPQTPPLPLIRASLALKATRTGELLDSLRERLRKAPSDKSEWGGMMMFLGQQVRADDPRMKSVYHNFERNLADIIDVGRRSGAGIVLSTVAVNLKDCAPFGSEFRPGISDADKAAWQQCSQRAFEAWRAGKISEAAEQLHQAARIDDSRSELRFLQAECALALGNANEARQQFIAARDLDTLRFRCDTRLNDLIREAAGKGETKQVLLADSDRVFAQQSAGEIPGKEFFYEHVHLTFEGNYLLARTIAEQIEKLLPKQVSPGWETQSWPMPEDCARRLAWSDSHREEALSEMLTRLQDPPFTAQMNHAQQVQYLTSEMQQLAPSLQPAGLARDRQVCEASAAAVPDDAWLQTQLASLKQASGDVGGATTNAERAVDLLPSGSELWMQLGNLLAMQSRFDDAANAFRRSFQLDSENVWALQDLAQALVKLKRNDDAMREFHHVLAIKPRFGLAWLGIGQLLEEKGRKAEAEECYQKALANRIHRAEELTTLARFCRGRGWQEAAVTNFIDAIHLDPSNVKLRLEVGQVLEAMGRHIDAKTNYAEAVRLAPDMVQSRFLYGLELGREGRPIEAAEQFREAVRIMPDLMEAWMNLGAALMQAGRNSEALIAFQEVLRLSPTNEMALRNVETVKAALNTKPAP